MTSTASPRRRTRPVNVTAVPTVPTYETEARKFVRANLTKNAAAKLEKAAKLACNQAMAQASVGSFEFDEGGVTYEAVIAGGEKKDVDIDLLYKKVTDGEITMPQFLKCVSSTQGAVKEHLGTNLLASVLIDVPVEASLSIGKKK